MVGFGESIGCEEIGVGEGIDSWEDYLKANIGEEEWV